MRRGPLGRTRVTFDERVDPCRTGDRAGTAGERLTSRQAHQVAGRTSTRPFSMRFMLATTFPYVSGGAMCSLRV